ncbi:hypothetical protein I541_5772 [Mycobacteroides abscessus]|nr:hypothetical protein I541_5772 [Mycobacteroides abscessus]
MRRRAGSPSREETDLFHRGKRLVNLDVKKDPEALLALVDKGRCAAGSVSSRRM